MFFNKESVNTVKPDSLADVTWLDTDCPESADFLVNTVVFVQFALLPALFIHLDSGGVCR